MKRKILFFPAIATVAFAIILTSFNKKQVDNTAFIIYKANPVKAGIKFFWKDDTGKPLKSLLALKQYCSSKNETLLFAMNGGMYKEDNSPLGLYIQNGKMIAPLNKKHGSGNFYLQPNGVFYISKNKTATICKTCLFKNNGQIEYATQSGPMLVVDGNINKVFTKGSSNINIRNGVGILPGNVVLFAMSKEPVNLYDFARFFKQAGCNNALYLDGFVSRTYLPEKNWVETDGNFGVMIGAVTNK